MININQRKVVCKFLRRLSLSCVVCLCCRKVNTDGGSFVGPITKRYGESISLESYITTKYGYTFAGWVTDPRTKQNQVTTFKFTKPILQQ